MKWIKYRLKIRDEAEDIVISALADAGVQGVEIEDSLALSDDELARMFVDIPPERRGEEGVAYLNFYLDPESEDTPAILARAKEELDALSAFCDIGEAAIEESETDNRDWENEWKKYFKPFRIDDILVVPSWAEDEPEGDASTVLRIDPGTAFGTGMHETTQLCIRQLRKHLKEGMRVLDIGTGSGILGILALKFGAAAVFGTDLDPNAEAAVKENCENNGVAEGFTFALGNIGEDAELQRAAGKNEIVLTNILADVLVELAPAAARALCPGGVWITSGIIEGKEADVVAAAEAAGLVAEEVRQQGEWMSVTARKTPE